MASLFAALGLVFVAELGDKTQLVALGFGARYRLLPVLTGLVVAYAATNLLSVVIGGVLGATFPTRVIGIAGGALFIVFAVWTMRSGGGDGGNADGVPDLDHRSIVTSVAGAIFVAEMGDKTMLATATLAARGNPVFVWIGATVGIVLSGTLGVLVGRVMGTRLPERVTRIASAVLFACFGVALLVASW